jgi:hypothetical protein
MKGPNVVPHEAGELKLNLPEGWRRNDVLYLTAKDPAGRELWTWSWSLDLSSPRTRATSGDIQTHDDGKCWVQTATLKLHFQKQTGWSRSNSHGRSCRSVTVLAVAFRRSDQERGDRRTSSLTDFPTRKEGADVS